MTYNILINSANLAIDPQNPANMLLLVDIEENAKLPPNVKVLVSTLPPHMIGFVVHELLAVLQMPSLGHIRQVPAVLDLEENKWSLVNFLDESQRFNVENVVNIINAAVTANQQEPSTSKPTTATDSKPVKK